MASGCTPFKTYRSCETDSDCPASLSKCLPQGLCAPRQPSELPSGVSVLSGDLEGATEATVVALLSRRATPQLNVHIQGGVSLAEALIPVNPAEGDRDIIWLNSQPAEGGAEELVGRFMKLYSLGVDIVVTPTMTRAELETLQGELEALGGGPPLFILSYEDPQPPPVSASFPVFAFHSTLSESAGRAFPFSLIQALIAERAEEQDQRVTFIYDRELSHLDTYRAELEALCASMSVPCSALPRDQRLEVSDQLGAWETLGLLPDHGLGEVVLWAVDSSSVDRWELLSALYERNMSETSVEIELMSLLGAVEDTALERSGEWLRVARRWSLQPAEHKLLPSPIVLSAQEGRSLSLSWPEGDPQALWFEAMQALWLESAVSQELIIAGAPLLARSFDIAALVSYVAQYVESPDPFHHHLTLSQLLSTSADSGADQLTLYPIQAGLLSRPTTLDSRVRASFYGVQGRLQFANQRAVNLPLPHLTCQVPGGPLFAEHVGVSASGAYLIPDGIFSRCRID